MRSELGGSSRPSYSTSWKLTWPSSLRGSCKELGPPAERSFGISIDFWECHQTIEFQESTGAHSRASCASDSSDLGRWHDVVAKLAALKTARSPSKQFELEIK